jgi:hypothetical protein
LAQALGQYFQVFLQPIHAQEDTLENIFNNFTSLAMHISLKFTCPASNFLESDKISYLTLLKSFVSISLLSICVIAKDVKGRPSLLTVYKPFPSYFGKLSLFHSPFHNISS